MKIFYKIFLALMCFLPIEANAEFVEGMSDIPLMDGMKQIHSANISFGNDESRFDEAYITSNKIVFDKVCDFYKNTLPQLGWKFLSHDSTAVHFEREAEVLDIALEKNKPTLVRITLKSKD